MTCSKFDIYASVEKTKQLFSASEHIVFFASETGPSAVIKRYNHCSHVYLPQSFVKSIAAEVGRYDRVTYVRDFENFAAFQMYMAGHGIYIAYFYWLEPHTITELSMFYRIKEQLPPVAYPVRLLRGELYNAVAYDNGVVFIRNVDIDEIIDYYTQVVSEIIDSDGKPTPTLLTVKKLYGIFTAKTLVRHALESGYVKRDDDVKFVKEMLRVIDEVAGLIKLATL